MMVVIVVIRWCSALSSIYIFKSSSMLILTTNDWLRIITVIVIHIGIATMVIVTTDNIGTHLLEVFRTGLSVHAWHVIISLLNWRHIHRPIFLISFVSLWFISDLSVIVVNCVLFLRNSIIWVGRAGLSTLFHDGVKTIEIVGVGGFSTC